MAEMQNERKKDAEKEKNTATLSKISNAIKGSEKLDVEGTDLLELLSHLEGELQARDVAIAALKSEQLKRVIYGCYKNEQGDRPGSPTAALQRDKTTVDDANTIDDEVTSATNIAEAQIAALQNVVERQKVAAQKMAVCLRESEKQRTRLVVELDEERAKHERDTAQGDDITYELEKDRIRLRQDLEAEVAEKLKLEVALKESMGAMEEEKNKQKQIVLVLLADRKKLMKLYLEEKKRSEDLAQMMQDEKTKMDTMAAGLEEESKRSLAMEAELEKHLSQFGSERQQLQNKLVTDERRYRDLEEALRKARADVEHFKKQLAEAHRVAMSQAAPPPPYPGPGSQTTLASTPLSVSPTPRLHPPCSTQNYATYSSVQVPNSYPNTVQGYSGGAGSAVVSSSAAAGAAPHTAARPTGLVTAAVAAGRAAVAGLQAANPVQRSQSGTLPNQSQKFHNNAGYSNNSSTVAGFGHSSHPALIPAGGVVGGSHLDQDQGQDRADTGNTYSQQLGMPKQAGGHPKAAPAPLSSSASTPSVPGSMARKQEQGQGPNSQGARKPMGPLGKGVPPPLPPNKPVVPVKSGKEGGMLGKRSESLVLDSKAGPSQLVSGLQGLKFGISIGGGSDPSGAKGLKNQLGPDSHVPPVSSVPGKKFFNNIESKS